MSMIRPSVEFDDCHETAPPSSESTSWSRDDMTGADPITDQRTGEQTS